MSSHRAPTVDELLSHATWVQTLARSLAFDPGRADDIAQETLRKALESPPRDRRNLRGWFTSTARNAARQMARSERSRTGREHDVARPEAGSSTADLVARAQLERSVVEHVLELAPTQRDVVLQHFFDGVSLREIARRENRSASTVREDLKHALAALRRRLDDGHGDRQSWVNVLIPAAALGTRSTPVLAIALGLGALVAGALTVRLFSEGSSSTAPVAALTSTSNTGGASTLTPLPAEAGTVSERSALAGPAPEGGDEPEALAPGSFALSVVSDETGEPIANLEYVVYSERRGDRLLASGRTNAKGRATVAGLPEDVLVVQTERRPPHAHGQGALWLPAKGTGALEVRVPRGASVYGRVVDDLGNPREGVEISIDVSARGGVRVKGDGAPVRDTALATTGADGRYRVDHLRSLDKGIWILDSGPRAKTEHPVRLAARLPQWDATWKVVAPTRVATEETVRAEDIVLAREVRVAGRVLDVDGQGIAGALVSSDPRRATALTSGFAWARGSGSDWVGTADALRSAEARTELDGSFSIVLPGFRFRQSVAVWTPDGRVFGEQLEKLSPGSSLTDLTLQAPAQPAHALLLVEENGKPVELDAGRPAGLWSRASFEILELEFLDEPREASSLVWQGNGRLLANLPDGRTNGRARLSLPCLSPVEIELAASTDAPQRVVVPSRRFVRARASTEGAPGVVLARLANVSVRACLDPAEPEINAQGGMQPITADACCGLGASANLTFQDFLAGIEIPVQQQAPYWIVLSLRGPGYEIPRTVLGPFEPGPVTHELEIDWATMRRRDKQHDQARRWRLKAPKTQLIAHVVDAETGEPIDRARLQADHADGTMRAHLSPADGENTPRVEVAAGTWDVLVTAHGYGKWKRANVTVDDQPLDLGLVQLERRPMFRGRAVGPDGQPVIVHGNRGEGETFEVLRDDTSPFLYGLSYRGPAGTRGRQIIWTGPWTDGEETDVTIEPGRVVDVVVVGLDATMQASHLSMHVGAPLALREAHPDHPLVRSYSNAGREKKAEPSRRTFRFLLTPGTYELHSKGRLVRVPPTQIVVEPGTDVQTLTVSGR